MSDPPGRVTERELRTELETDLDRSYDLRTELRVAAIEPGRLPPVGLVRQMELGASASISALPHPGKPLVETTTAYLDG
jgi:hypothetical protein